MSPDQRLEVNISCPNVASAALESAPTPHPPGRYQSYTGDDIAAVIVKLTPTLGYRRHRQAVAAAGAEAVSLINTFKGMAIDIKETQTHLANITGGLSGPAV